MRHINFCGLFNAKLSLIEEQWQYCLSHSWGWIRGFISFPSPKMNLISWVEIELVYKNVAIKHISCHSLNYRDSPQNIFGFVIFSGIFYQKGKMLTVQNKTVLQQYGIDICWKLSWGRGKRDLTAQNVTWELVALICLLDLNLLTPNNHYVYLKIDIISISTFGQYELQWTHTYNNANKMKVKQLGTQNNSSSSYAIMMESHICL